jgi:hypothetical protein
MVTGRVARIMLVVLETLMGLAAVGGSVGLILTNGLGMPVEWLKGSPFGSYTIPGLVLLVVGSINLAGAAGVLPRHRWGAPVSAVAGLMWMEWFVVQVAVVSFVSWQQPDYFVIGVLIIALAVPSLVGQRGKRIPPRGVRGLG